MKARASISSSPNVSHEPANQALKLTWRAVWLRPGPAFGYYRSMHPPYLSPAVQLNVGIIRQTVRWSAESLLDA